MARMLLAAVSALALFSASASNNLSAQTATPSETTALPRPDFNFKGQVGARSRILTQQPSRRSCAHRRAHPTLCSFCSMTSGSVSLASLEGV
jgi:hypothetical protein